MQSAAKRYKVTGSGKVMARRPGKQHLNEKMSKSNKKKLSKENPLFVGDVRSCLPLCRPHVVHIPYSCRVTLDFCTYVRATANCL